MAEYDISKSTTSDLATGVDLYEVPHVALDVEGDQQKKTWWDNSNYDKYNGYYLNIPEYQTALNGFATWVVGKGWTSDDGTTAILENIRGWGEDTFQSILWNGIVMKKIHGDAFIEIMRNPETGTLINLKPLGTLRIIVDEKGIITEYQQINKNMDGSKSVLTFKPEDVLHLCNNRIGNQIHGTSITTSVQWVIDSRNEAMSDWRRISHRSTIRIMEVDEDDTTKLNDLKAQYKEAINKGELMLIPKGTAAPPIDFSLPPVQNYLNWIQYLESFFYQALGVPKSILGGFDAATESNSKMSYLSYEQIYLREIQELQNDLWNQVALRVEFNKPASIKDELRQDEGKDTDVEGLQPSETKPSVTRNE